MVDSDGIYITIYIHRDLKSFVQGKAANLFKNVSNCNLGMSKFAVAAGLRVIGGRVGKGGVGVSC